MMRDQDALELTRVACGVAMAQQRDDEDVLQRPLSFVDGVDRFGRVHVNDSVISGVDGVRAMAYMLRQLLDEDELREIAMELA